MPRKNKTDIELLAPHAPTEADFKRMIAEAVDQKVAEAISGSDAIFQPFFQPRAVANEIRRKQTCAEKYKWGHYYEKWGCLVCGTKDAIHHALGMCHTCHRLVDTRLQAVLRQHGPAVDQFRTTFVDTVKLAREALGLLNALPPGSTTRRRTK